MKMRKWLSALLCAAIILTMPVSASAAEVNENETTVTEAAEEGNTDAQQDSSVTEEPAKAEENGQEDVTLETEQETETTVETEKEEAEENEEVLKEQADAQETEAEAGSVSEDTENKAADETEDATAEEQNEPALQSENSAPSLLESRISGPRETENNNSQSTADTIYPNQSINGNISSKDDVDWYKITLQSNCYISLTLGHAYLESGNTWYVNFYNTSSDVTYDMSIAGTETSKRSCRLGLPRGTYYIKVSGDWYSHSSINYNLRVNYVAVNYWETENNDSISSADSIAPNKSVTGSLPTKEDNDYYKFTLGSNGYISLTLNHTYIENSGRVWTVRLFRGSDGTLLEEFDYAGNIASQRSCRIGLPKGTYYAEVMADWYSHSDMDYNLRVNYVAASYWETETNNSFSSADSISPNVSVTGSLMKDDDTDYYKFTTGSNGYISLTLNHSYIENSGNYWKVRLYRGSDTTLIEDFYYQGNVSSQKSCRVGLPKGTYYLQVIKGDWNLGSDVDYNLRVNYVADKSYETEINDSTSSADTITKYATSRGTLMTRDDEDYYTFSLGARCYVNFRLTHGYVDNGNDMFTLTVSNRNNVPVMTYSLTGKQTGTNQGVVLPAGKYYVKISSEWDHSTTPYGLVVEPVK